MEVLLATFFNFVPPEVRTVDHVADNSRKALFSLRPAFSPWGLAPGQLAKGVDHIATLGDLERKWVDEVRESCAGLELPMPEWWQEIYGDN
ncbi:MAG: hypothetical protein AB1Z98_18780 [Nannocystaceae bacterium]